MNERHAKWHCMTAEAVLEQLHTDAACGLSRKAARSRFKKLGENTLFLSGRGGLSRTLLDLIKDASFLLLLFSLVLSFLFSQTALALAVLSALVLCIFIWIKVWRNAKNAEAVIGRYRIPRVRVLREGCVLSLPANRVTVGDLVLLKKGDIVPADCRLLEACDLCVATLMPNESGKPIFVQTPKNADAVYPYLSAPEAPFCENMLFARSEILEGEGRAIITEIGNSTYLGGIDGFPSSAELRSKKSNRGDRAINALRPYLRLYGIMMLILLLLFSAIALFSAMQEQGFLQTFVPLCALCAAASTGCILWYFYMVSAKGTAEGLSTKPLNNQSVLLSEEGSEAFSTLTDLFVIGHGASSDGVAHFYLAALPWGETVSKEDDQPSTGLQPLCEAFCLLREASRQGVAAPHLASPAVDRDVLCEELIATSGFDLEALRIRLLRTYSISSPYEEGERIHVQTREAEFSLLFSGEIKILDQCHVYENHGKRILLSPHLRQGLRHFFARVREEGAEPIAVVKKDENDVPSLLGIVSTREEPQAILPSVIEELAQSGVRTTFFFTGDPKEELAYAQACRIHGKARICSSEERFVEDSDLDTHRIWIGLSHKALARLLQRMRNGGRRVALLGAGPEDRELLRSAHLVIAYDPDNPRMGMQGDRGIREEGHSRKKGSAQVVRYRADALIHSAQRFDGGLSAVLAALSHCRSISIRMRLLFSFLTVSQLSRLLLTFLSLCLGLGTLSGWQMTYTGLYVESVATLCILSVPIPQNRLRRFQPFGEKDIWAMLSNPRTYLPICISVAGTTLLGAILCWTGVVGRGVLIGALFLSLLLLQISVFYRTILAFDIRPGIKKSILPALIMILPVLLATLLSLLFPVVNEGIGLGAWSIFSAVLALTLPTLFWISRFFLSFFHRTAK